MVANTSRVLDAVIIGEESTPGTETSAYTLDLFGDIKSCSLKTDENRKVLNGLKGASTTGHLPTRIVALKVTPSGTMTFHPNSFRFLKYAISDFQESSGTYTLDNRSIALPKSLSFKGAYDETSGIRHLGVYMTNVRPSINDDDILTITVDLVSLFSDTFTGAVAYTPPSADPLTYVGGVFTIDGNEWDLQNITLGYDPKFIQKWGVTTKATGKKRFPTAIFRGGKGVIPFDGVCNVDDITTELEVAWGGTSPDDAPVDSALILTFTDGSAKDHILNVTGQIINTNINQDDSEENSKTMSFNGVGIDFSASGDT